jgi:hypothetical protein
MLALAPLIGAAALALFSVLAHRLHGRASAARAAPPPAPQPCRLARLLELWASWMERLDPQARFWGPAAVGLLIGLLWTLIDG